MDVLLSATSIDGKSLVVVGNFTLADKNFSVTFQKLVHGMSYCKTMSL